MQTSEHRKHIASNVSHNNCPECRADTERRFVNRVANCAVWQYGYVHEYLAYIRPRLEAIRESRDGGNTVAGRRWEMDFRKAMHTRISLKVPATEGRKYSGGYLERLRMTLSGRGADAGYLRRFASRGASCLDR